MSQTSLTAEHADYRLHSSRDENLVALTVNVAVVKLELTHAFVVCGALSCL